MNHNSNHSLQPLTPVSSLLNNDMPHNADEWRVALSDPNSYLYKMMVNSIMEKLVEKKIIEDMVAAFVSAMQKLPENINPLTAKVFATEAFAYKPARARSMGLFS